MRRLVEQDQVLLLFNTLGTPTNTAIWKYEIGYIRNNELQFYTRRPENVRLENGQLIVEARREDYQGSRYTSARLKTQGLKAWKYGRVEARIKIPRGQGIWPAFWMLGDNILTEPWPRCGEIDILENIGKEPAIVHGTVHGPGYSGVHGVGGLFELSTGAFADDFHVYAIEWEAEQIRWLVDEKLYLTVTPKDVPSRWVFDHPFFIILNVAVGGGWPGNPTDDTLFPQSMLVDYVRVYKYVAAPPDPPTALKASPGSAKVFLSWNASTNGANGYNVKRSTVSGGSYSTIA